MQNIEIIVSLYTIISNNELEMYNCLNKTKRYTFNIQI